MGGRPPFDRWTIIILTCRTPQTDFRLALAEELRRLGNKVLYVFLKRRPAVSVLDADMLDRPSEVSFYSFVAKMRNLSKLTDKLLVFNSTNLAFPITSVLLKQVTGGLWCFDIHDDLLYEQMGWKRLKAAIAQKLLIWQSHISVHSAPTLAELFPLSRHLGNASHIIPLSRRGEFQADPVLILASLDGRFDFELARDIARLNRDISFHLHGQISQGSSDAEYGLKELLKASPNVVYFGPYSNDVLPGLLDTYCLTLAPYRTNCRLTRYIDPLRFYHCLNSGLELITTDIPAAQNLTDKLHVISKAQDFRPLVAQLSTQRDKRRNFDSHCIDLTWRRKAEALMQIVGDHAAVNAHK